LKLLHTIHKNSKKLFALSLLLVVGLLLSACSRLPSTSWPGLATTEGVVYVTSQGLLLAIKEGGEMWRFPEKADSKQMIYATPAFGDGKIYVGDYGNNVHAIDPTSGKEVWIFADRQGKGRMVGGVLMVGNTILAPSTDHFLYALDLNGKMKWKFQARNSLWTQPVSDGKVVYLSGMDHYLYAIDLTSGKLIWERDLDNALIAAPILDNGNLYSATLGSEMISVNAQTGKVQWRTVTEGSAWSHPLLNEGTLYFGTDKGKVFAVDLNGTVKWQMDAGGAILGTPVLFGEGFAVTTENGEIHLFDFTGARPWSRQLTGKLYSSPVVVNDRLVVAGVGTDTILTTYDASGTTSWTYNPAK
jgi:eukaryotic-like serine/threonine-protein kinase